MPKRKPTTIKLPHGAITRMRGGYLATYWSPKGRLRKRFRILSEAIKWLGGLEIQFGAGKTLSHLQIADALQAIDILPQGVSLVQSALEYVANNSCASRGLSLAEAIDKFIQDKKSIGLSEQTLRQYTGKLVKFQQAMGYVSVCSITSEQVSDYVADLTAYTRNNTLRALSSLFGSLVKAKVINHNPVQVVEKAKIPSPPKGILSVENARLLLDSATDNEVRMYLAIGMFAGLRPMETMRLPVSAIKKDYIVLDASITKTADARTVRIREALRSYLGELPRSGKVIVSPYNSLRAKISSLSRKIGVPIPHDGLRHSFASYAYAVSKDASAVASELGHVGTEVFFKHYRALALPEEGERYFALRMI